MILAVLERFVYARVLAAGTVHTMEREGLKAFSADNIRVGVVGKERR